jgi:cold shock protein
MSVLKLNLSRVWTMVLDKMGYAAPISTQQKKSIPNKPGSKFRAKTKTMEKGTIKFFNEAKGFGFIKSENGQEVFVHASSLRDEVRENDSVVFEIQNSPKGLNAVNVKLA